MCIKKKKKRMTKTTTRVRVTDFPLQTTPVKHPVKGVKWASEEPKGQARVEMHKVCPKCILVAPKSSEPAAVKKDPKNYKFPVCTRKSPSSHKTPTTSSSTCQLNCTGVLAANRRARLTGIYPDVQKLTSDLLQKFKCTKAAVERERKKKPQQKQHSPPPPPPKTSAKKKTTRGPTKQK